MYCESLAHRAVMCLQVLTWHQKESFETDEVKYHHKVSIPAHIFDYTYVCAYLIKVK